MTIAATIAALQTRHAALSGVATAPARTPDTVPAANCPAVLVDADAAETRWAAHGGNVYATRRTYVVRILAQPAGLGASVGQGRALAATVLDACLASYVADPVLASGVEIVIDQPGAVRDSGVLPGAGREDAVRHGADLFVGAEIRLLIEERYG